MNLTEFSVPVRFVVGWDGEGDDRVSVRCGMSSSTNSGSTRHATSPGRIDTDRDRDRLSLNYPHPDHDHHSHPREKRWTRSIGGESSSTRSRETDPTSRVSYTESVVVSSPARDLRRVRQSWRGGDEGDLAVSNGDLIEIT